MSGRGRGRGRGRFLPRADLLGPDGEAAPPVLEPPPMYPELEFKPITIPPTDELKYCLTLKQEFRTAMRASPYYIVPPTLKKDIERYSDKYSAVNTSSNLDIDWSRLPKQLKPALRKAKNPSNTAKKVDHKEILETLNKLEAKEKEADAEPVETEPKPKNENDEDEEEKDGEDEDYYNESEEEETDYVSSYFDNGEGYGDDDDDNMDDGPTY